MQEDYYLTGNEEDESFIYYIKKENYGFQKKITINHELEHDVYEERFRFSNYYFVVGKHILKINASDINKEFVENFQCDIGNESYCYVWNIMSNRPANYAPVELERPNNVLKQFSEQLYNKYKTWYDLFSSNSNQNHLNR